METERPFLDYYASLGTTPVRQDIADLQRHIERRASLYALLGIPPRFFALADVLEFGPGLGHNALAVAKHRPRRHVLVDGNPAGIAGLKATLREHFGTLEAFEIVESTVEAYEDARGFDVVLAENLIPLQRDPIAFTRTIARHVRPGGVLVVTCTDAVSFMGEMLRRAVALKAAPPSLPLDERVARLRELFASHLAQLPGVSRPVDDWIKDNVTHPYVGEFFSVADAVAAVGEEFDAYGGSPRMAGDWRWYKQLYGSGRRFNERACEAYRANVVNLMDWRIELPPQSPELGARLLQLCGELWRCVRDAEERPGEKLEAIAARCDAIAAEAAPASARTAASIAEVAAYLRAPAGEPPERHLREFGSYFGRGAQYLSFLRRTQ